MFSVGVFLAIQLINNPYYTKELNSLNRSSNFFIFIVVLERVINSGSSLDGLGKQIIETDDETLITDDGPQLLSSLDGQPLGSEYEEISRHDEFKTESTFFIQLFEIGTATFSVIIYLQFFLAMRI